MRGLILYQEQLIVILEIHSSLHILFNTVYNNQHVLKHFESGRFKQLKHKELEGTYECVKDDPGYAGGSYSTVNSIVSDNLKKLGYRKKHWGMNPRFLNEIEYMIDTLRIVMEPDFIPLEVEGEEKETPDRHIPSNVKMAVWRRDGGKCVECESKEKLEYDHIIPISKGGSNTERNIQLLCEKCNRKKATHIE
ncbi:MAG: HNH endonuclease [Thermoplasmata archaeon]|nr:HNH endonuclease [Thermoplasmata archaeon]